MKTKIIISGLTGYVIGCVIAAIGLQIFWGHEHQLMFLSSIKYFLLYSLNGLFIHSMSVGWVISGAAFFSMFLLARAELKKEKPSFNTIYIFLITLALSSTGSFISAKVDYQMRQLSLHAREGWDDLTSVTIIETPEIIRILEEENVFYVETQHSQEIHIILLDGTKLMGNYVHSEAGAYSEKRQFFDIYNLAMYIRNQRPERERWGYCVE